MRYLGLDIGEARVGVAVSDPTGSVATPVDVLDARRLESDLRAFNRLIEDHEPDALVVGLPLTMGGDEGPQARVVRVLAERLADASGLPLVFWDERLSSVEARRILSASGVSDKKQRGKVDKLAAALVLQSYLDAQGSCTTEGDPDE